MSILEERMDTLESILGQFIVNNDIAMRKQERDTKLFRDEMREFKDEMREFKDEMREFKKDAIKDKKEMNRKWGDLANKMGTVVEDIVAPNIKGIAKRYFDFNDIEDFMIRRVKKNVKNRSRSREFDVIAVCDNKVIINETKSYIRIEYINEFIDVLKKIGDYFPEYKDKKIIPVFSSLYLQENITAFLTKNKIYAMAMKDDTMEIVNFDFVIASEAKQS